MMRLRLGLYWLALLISGCSFFGTADEGEPPAPLVEINPEFAPTVLWTADVGEAINSDQLKLTLALKNDTIFTTTSTGNTQALNLETGQLVWQKELETPISAGVGLSEEFILLGSRQGEVIALTQNAGAEQWRVQVSSEILAVPQSSQGIVVARTVDGKLVALDAQSGGRLWEYSWTLPVLTLRGTSSPVLIGDKVLAGSDNGKLALLDLRSGKLLWEVPVAVPHGRSELERMVDVDTDPKIMEDTVYAASFQGRIAALSLYNGDVLWGRDASSYTGVDVDAKAVYVSDTDSHLWALDRFSGASLWKQTKLHARQITAPLVLGEYLIVGDGQGYLHWLKRSDGQFVARHKVSAGRIFVPPLLKGQTLLVYDSEGKIEALRVH